MWLRVALGKGTWGVGRREVSYHASLQLRQDVMGMQQGVAVLLLLRGGVQCPVNFVETGEGLTRLWTSLSCGFHLLASGFCFIEGGTYMNIKEKVCVKSFDGALYLAAAVVILVGGVVVRALGHRGRNEWPGRWRGVPGGSACPLCLQ